MKRILYAQYLATKYHSNQKRKIENVPYIIHPTRVAMNVEKYWDPIKCTFSLEDALIVAYLHDTLEDTQITKEEIVHFFGSDILFHVEEVTTYQIQKYKMGGKEKYLFHKLRNISKLALFVKLCDRLDNIQSWNGIQTAKSESYCWQTVNILKDYETELDFHDICKDILKMCWKILVQNGSR